MQNTLLTCHKAPRIHGIWLRLPAAPVVPIKPLSTATLCVIKLREQVKPKETKSVIRNPDSRPKNNKGKSDM
jgi:hypothetical protein